MEMIVVFYACRVTIDGDQTTIVQWPVVYRLELRVLKAPRQSASGSFLPLHGHRPGAIKIVPPSYLLYLFDCPL